MKFIVHVNKFNEVFHKFDQFLPKKLEKIIKKRVQVNQLKINKIREKKYIEKIATNQRERRRRRPVSFVDKKFSIFEIFCVFLWKFCVIYNGVFVI